MLEPVVLDLEKPTVRLIDQRRLPQVLEYLDASSIEDMVDAIRTLAVRGAPAIGIAAAYSVALEAHKNRSLDLTALRELLDKAAERLAGSRPTAVNLFNALERIRAVAQAEHPDSASLASALEKEARLIHQEDLEASREMGRAGAELISDGDACLTHCNAGALATGGLGTALAVFYAAREAGKNIHVYADETRPLLQGARLTAFELLQNGIPCTLICDDMAGFLMKQQRVQAVFTGADRVARNGDAANKIGTYSLAVLANHHRIPFYIVAPVSTFDADARDGSDIPIEERRPDEVRGFRSEVTAPEDVEVWNPAFDVTPAELITAIITEKGVHRPPYTDAITSILTGEDAGA